MPLAEAYRRCSFEALTRGLWARNSRSLWLEFEALSGGPLPPSVWRIAENSGLTP